MLFALAKPSPVSPDLMASAIRGPPRNWGSSGDRRWRGYIVRWIKLLPEVETERTIVDGATNLKQQIRAAP